MRAPALLLSLLAVLAVGCPSSTDDDMPDASLSDASMPDSVSAPLVCEIEAPESCEEPAPTYADVEPIIARRCLGCHDGTMELWPLTSYTHVTAWYAEIRSVMLACAMPPSDSGLTMPDEEREQILMWLRCGFPQ